jgi:hypothetical protein
VNPQDFRAAGFEEAWRDCQEALLYWHEGADPRPLEAVLEFLAADRRPAERPLSARELRAVVRRARAFAEAAYPAWRWPERVVGAIALAWLARRLAARRSADRRMGEDDPLARSYRKLIENRSAWMPA